MRDNQYLPIETADDEDAFAWHQPKKRTLKCSRCTFVASLAFLLATVLVYAVHHQRPPQADLTWLALEDGEALQNAKVPLLEYPVLATMQPNLPGERDQLWLLSAYLDTRTLWRAGELVKNGVPTVIAPVIAPRSYAGADDYLCLIRIIKNGQSTLERRPLRLVTHQGDTYHTKFTLAAYSAECDGDSAWLDANVELTLAITHIDSTSNLVSVETPVTKAPRLNIEQHTTGLGPSAVCISPVRGDMYAPSLLFHADYYTRVLGMQTIYLYLSDPAPALLDSIRQVMKETKIDLRPVIFSHSSAWVNATNPTSISVPYSQWNLSGLIIPPLTHETPIFAPLGNWHVHYGAQMAATYDCQLRAMANGFRWVAQLDLDEYIVPVLPNKIPWSGSITSPIFLRQLGKEANARKPLGALRSKPTLSHYYEFRSTFVRSDHGPVSPPPDEIVPKGMTAERIFHPDILVPPLFSSSIRQDLIFPMHVRSKFIYDPWAMRFLSIHHWNQQHSAFRKFEEVILPSLDDGQPHQIRAALWHARVNRPLAAQLVKNKLVWGRQPRLAAMRKDRGRAVIAASTKSGNRTLPDRLIQGWTFLESMGPAVMGNR